MKRHSTILKSAIAVALGLGAANAFAGTFNVSTLQFAVEQIPSSNGVVSIPANKTQSYTVGPNGLKAGDSVEFSLGNGATFNVIPGASATALNPDGTTTPVTLEQTIANSSTVQFKVPGTTGVVTLPAGSTINLKSYKITVPSSFNTPTSCISNDFQGEQRNIINMTVKASVTSGSDEAPTGKDGTKAVVASCSSVSVPANQTPARVDIASKALKFVKVDGFSNASVAEIGWVQRINEPLNLLADGVNLINAVKADGTEVIAKTVTLTVTGGSFAGISGIEVRTNNCDVATATKQVKGTIDSATGVAKIVGKLDPGLAYNICLTGNGSDRLANNNQFTVETSVAYADIEGTTSIAKKDVGKVTYNGEEVKARFVVGGTTGYSSYIRVVNKTNTKVDLYASVAPDSGTGALFEKLDTLDPYGSKLFTATDLNSKVGSKLETAADKANVSIFGVGTGSVDGGNIILNTDGTVTQVP